MRRLLRTMRTKMTIFFLGGPSDSRGLKSKLAQSRRKYGQGCACGLWLLASVEGISNQASDRGV